MNQTANQLLNNIFNVLSKIEKKINTPTSNIASGVTKNGITKNNITTGNNTKNNTIFSNILLIPTINKMTKGFQAKNSKDAMSYLKFVDNLVKINIKADKVKDKTAIDTLLKNTFSDKTIYFNIKLFNKLSDSGIISKYINGLGLMVDSIKRISNKISKSDIKKLNNVTEFITKPLTTISDTLISFGKSILIFGGTFLAIGAIFGFGTASGIFAATLGGIALTLVSFVGMMSLIGKISKGADLGIKTLKSIGNGLVSFSMSLVVMASSILILNKITGSAYGTAGALIGGIATISVGLLAIVGTMMLINKISTPSLNGVRTLNKMSLGLITVSVSLAIAGGLLYGATFLKMGNYTSTPLAIAGGLLVMSGLFAIIGNFSNKIIKGSISVALMSLSILGFSYSLYHSVNIMQKIFNTTKDWADISSGGWSLAIVVGGIVAIGALYSFALAPMLPGIALGALGVGIISLSIYGMMSAIEKVVDIHNKVPKDIGVTLKDAIGGFVGGIWEGFKIGFGFKDGEYGKNALKGAVKVVALTTASGMLMSLSASMIKYAEAISHFGSNGNIQLYTIDNDGNIHSGKSVNTVVASKSVGIAISSFLTEVSYASNKISFDKIAKISEVLLGTASASFLGLKIKPKPGLLDATIKFASMLDKFAGEKGSFRIYNEDTKKFTNVSVTTIANNISSAIVTFFTNIVKGVNELGTDTNYAKVEEMALLLMGKSGTWSLGWKGIRKSEAKIGILEPVMKFAEIVKLLGNGKYLKDGVEMDMNLDGAKIAEKIVSFSKALSDGLSNSEIGDINTEIKGFDRFTQFMDTLGSKTDVIDRVATSIDRLAESTSKLVDNINNLNISNLEKLYNNQIDVNNSNIRQVDNNQNSVLYPQQTNYIDNSDAVANKVLSALTMKTFTFEFMNNSGGKLVLR